MRDKMFEFFISKFGEATQKREVPQSSIDAWRGRLPEQMLTYWKAEGWCGYQNGLLWTVNPDDYEDLVRQWLAGTSLAQVDTYHVIARGAFGDLYLCGEKGGSNMTLSCQLHAIFALPHELRPKSESDRNHSIQSFFGVRKTTHSDQKDAAGQPLFSRALAKLGPLAVDEMYGFEPALVAGGTNDLAHLAKVKLEQHLTILRQLAKPSIPLKDVDIEKLIKG